MSQNPYSTPNAAPSVAVRESSLICTGMFWLSFGLCIVVFCIAANGSYQYGLYTSRGITLPTRILAENAIVACSGIGMLYATLKWRRQSFRAGALSLVCSLLIFFVGPPLLGLFV